MAVQAALFSIRRRDEENDDDDMDDLEHASDNEDEIYTLGLAQRRAEAADRATKLGGDCTEGGAPWAVLLSKFLAAEGVIQRQKEDGKRAYGHERGEAEAVLAAIHRVTTSAESNKQNYLSLLTYIVSLLLFLVVVMMQRVPQEMFQVEEAVRSALLADEGGLVESFSGEAATEIDAMTDVHTFIKGALIDAAWSDPVCGNGVCEGPFEQKSFGRFGCAVDCGVYSKHLMTKVVVDMSALFKNDLNRSRARWNLRSTTFDFNFYERDQTFTELNETVKREVYLIDGDWQLYVEAYRSAVTGKITSTERVGNQTITSTFSTWGACNVTSTERALIDKTAERNKVRSLYRPNGPPCCVNGSIPTTVAQAAASKHCVSACGTTSCDDFYTSTLSDYALQCSSCDDPGIGRCAPASSDFFKVIDQPPESAKYSTSNCYKSAASGQKACVETKDGDASCIFFDFGMPSSALGFTLDYNVKCFAKEEKACVIESARLRSKAPPVISPITGMVMPTIPTWCDPITIGDGNCNEDCNIPSCFLDGGDCPSTAAMTVALCSDACACSMLGNGQCDPDCDVLACGYDAGDCCPVPTYEERVPQERLIGKMNRIIAGILVTQKRVQGDTTCGATSQTIAHRFPELMPTCTIREGKVIEDQSNFGVDPLFLPSGPLYRAEVAANQHRYYTDPTHQVNEQGLPFGFTGGDFDFPVFLDINLPSSRAQLFASYMKEGGYIQHARAAAGASSTRSVEIQFLTYNANYKLFCFTEITFEADQGGRISVALDINAFDVELFDEPTDFIRLILELLFMFGLLLQISIEIREAWVSARGENGRWEEPFTYCGIMGVRRGVPQCTLTGFWNLFDIVSIALFALYFLLWWVFVFVYAIPFSPKIRYDVYSDLNAEGFILRVEEKGLKEMSALFAECRSITQFSHTAAVVSVLNMSLVIIRLFKQLDFQEQFNVVSKVIIGKAAPLGHFFALFGGVNLLFATAGCITFGKSTAEFRSIWESLWSCHTMLMGDLEIAGKLRELDQPSQLVAFLLFYLLYMTINVLLLLNVLLAIIVEGYTDVAAANKDALSLPVELSQLIRNVVTERTRSCYTTTTTRDSCDEESPSSSSSSSSSSSKPMTMKEIATQAANWLDIAATNRIPKTAHLFPPPGEQVVALRMSLKGGGSRLIVPTRDVLLATVRQHFVDIGAKPAKEEEEVVQRFVDSVMLYFSDYPQTDLLPEEMRDAHAAARSSCRTRAAHGDDSGATRGFANTEIDINTGLVKSARSMRGVMKSEVRVAPVDAGGEGVELVGTKSQEGEAGS